MSMLKEANSKFLSGNYDEAKIEYEKIKEIYKFDFLSFNISLCDLRKKNLSIYDFSSEKEKLLKIISDLEKEISNKDLLLNERFREICILTKMLEDI